MFLPLYSSTRWGPSPPGLTPSSRARTSTSPSSWTRRRTYSGALRWRGKPHSPVRLPPAALAAMEISKIMCPVSSPSVRPPLAVSWPTALPRQGLWLPGPLYGRVQHEPTGTAEAPGPIVERPRHPPPVCTTQRLLCLCLSSEESV